MLGLQFDNKIAAIQVFLVFLQVQEGQGGEEKTSIASNCSIPRLSVCENSQWSRILPFPADWLVSYWCLPCSCRSRMRLISLTRWTGCAERPRKRQSLPQWACPEGSAWLHQASSSPDTQTHTNSLHLLLIFFATHPKLAKCFQMAFKRAC